ncbi:uncharacterized protein LOC143892971 [Tasmannia lanceolata]|uniref:uncharacterized protein LOC143892971 n=1 Tax=Tasmannia lanceolata TaxID=3420 RepID=UPI004063D1C9
MSSFVFRLPRNPFFLLSRSLSSSPSSPKDSVSSRSKSLTIGTDLQNFVKKFKTFSQSYRFRGNVQFYQNAVRRLALAKQFSLIEEILEAQKKYINPSREGLGTCLISLYGKSGMFDLASKTFDELPQLKCPRTVKSFNALLTAALESKNFEKVGEIFNKFPSELSVTPNVVSYNILIQAFCKMGSLDSAFSVLEIMEDNGVSPDLITFNTLLNGFYVGNRISDAEMIWTKMEEHNCIPDIISFNSRLRGLVSEGKMDNAIKLVDELKSKGPKPDVFSFNALIKGFCNDGNIEEAKKIYNELGKNGCNPNRWTFEMLVPCLCEKGDFDLAIKLCEESISHSCFIDVGILQGVIDGLAKESRITEAKKLADLGLSKIQYRSTLKLPSEAE